MSNKSSFKILAVETSCDETAAAVVEVQCKKHGSYEVNSIKILSNIVASQIEIHKKFGGVFPEYASRAHSEKIIPVVEQAFSRKAIELKATTCHKPDLIAVTVGPGLIGSLLVGVNFAKTYAYTQNLPIIGINHWLGHIYSCFVGEIKNQNDNSKFKNKASSEVKSGSQAPQEGASATAPVERTSFYDELAEIPQFPALILIASGGHTGLVLMKSHTEIETLGETLDDAAGEAFDKVAKLLQLDYPGGPAIATEAAKIRNPKHAFRHSIRNKFQIPNVKFPRSMLDKPGYNFSFSGLKTAVLYKVKELTKSSVLSSQLSAAIAAEFQQTVIDILIGKTVQAAYEFHPKSICLCGGMSANKELRQQLKLAVEKLPSKPSYHIPPLELATDNAAMIGVAAAYQSVSWRTKKHTSWDKIHADANLRL